MADLPGGGSRLSGFVYKGEGYFMVEKGECAAVVLDSHTEFQEKTLPVPYKIFNELEVGQRLIIGDGVVSFVVTEVDGGLCAKAEGSGRVESNRGVSVQGGSFSPVCLTETDKKTLLHVAEHAVYDEVALSFVGNAADIEEARKILGDADKKIVAKIETPEGIKNIESIAKVADKIMVARGDLALTMPWQEMPKAIDVIVEACDQAHTPYIMATQVAESMATAHMMTRAEMSDLWQWKKRVLAVCFYHERQGGVIIQKKR